jgi:hypothetical protein
VNTTPEERALRPCAHPHERRVTEVLASFETGSPVSYRGQCQLCGTYGPERGSRSAAAWAFGHLASMWLGPLPGSPEAPHGS